MSQHTATAAAMPEYLPGITDYTAVPKPYRAITKSALGRGGGVSGIMGYHDETPSGSWATDGYRIYYDCSDSDLPDVIRSVIPDCDAQAIWPVTDGLYRWLRLMAMHTRCVLMADDRWTYRNEGAEYGDIASSDYLQAPPVPNHEAGYDPGFLAEAIVYLLGRKPGKRPQAITFGRRADGPLGPCVMRADGRAVALMPVALMTAKR